MAIDSSDNVCVIDTLNNCVQKFTDKDKLLTIWSSDKLESSKNIYLFPNNIVYVVDTRKSSIKFDVRYVLCPLKFYIEFQIKIDGNHFTSGRV